MTAGGEQTAQTYEKAQDGTLYWTLSLYISPERVAEAAGRKGQRLDHRLFERVQRAHMPSQALRDAIDPLFNDIADREVLGEVQEMLLAATGAEDKDAKAAGKAIRTPEALTFHPPAEIAWTTEGVTYRASPDGLGDARAVRFRRFWFAHNNGALSYHMSFSHHYAAHTGKGGGYGPATYYFLSLLQKLAAPKEFTLKAEIREAGGTVSALEPDLGGAPNPAPEAADACGTIAPLDRLEVADASGKRQRFWPFVEDRLTADAEQLFERLAAAMESGTAPEKATRAPLRWQDLIEEVPFIEVPGLTIPKSRFMFVVHDDRFFKRLMPLDPVSGETAARKAMVQEPCYEPYQDKLASCVDKASKGNGVVQLDAKFWKWVRLRPDYRRWIGGSHPKLRSVGGGSFATPEALTEAIRTDGAEWVKYRRKAGRIEQASVTPMPPVPAFEPQRTDCLDYLFLAGFNQNIIDFMNQDTSEILDSIDPIYPDSDEQSDERFFVRYANHRAMITYVPKSRSLETGNDYIGTCPYAFLIHVMSLHNEYLAREHEAKSMARIEHIEWLVAGEKDRIPLSDAADAIRKSEALRGGDTELAINQAKLAEYRDYERFRYANPFRYDTERDVFAKLEELRGITRKKEALALAIASLEDHASDLQRRHERQTDRAAARRETQLSILLGGTGIFGAGQMMYWIGDDMMKAGATETLSLLGLHDLSISGAMIVDGTKAVMYFALAVFVPYFCFVAGGALRGWLKRKWKDWRARQDSNLRPPA